MKKFFKVFLFLFLFLIIFEISQRIETQFLNRNTFTLMVQLNLQNEMGMKRLNQMEKKNKEKEKKEKKERVKRERFEMNVVLVMKLNSKNLEWINLHKIEKGNLLFSKKKLFILFGVMERGKRGKIISHSPLLEPFPLNLYPWRWNKNFKRNCLFYLGVGGRGGNNKRENSKTEGDKNKAKKERGRKRERKL